MGDSKLSTMKADVDAALSVLHNAAQSAAEDCDYPIEARKQVDEADATLRAELERAAAIEEAALALIDNLDYPPADEHEARRAWDALAAALSDPKDGE